MTGIDNANVRQQETCPVCLNPKSKGLVVCWKCFNEHDMRNGNSDIESILHARESCLRAAKKAAKGAQR